MSDSDWRNWPALADGPKMLPDRIEYQRGVFGKVHGARSDYRWIALSGGFRRGKELESALYLGARDQPKALSFWRHLASPGAQAVHFAGYAYPSRAQDAAGREGFLETQIADLGPMNLPAALVALAFLSVLRQWDDGIWWERRHEQNWEKPESTLSIEACSMDLHGRFEDPDEFFNRMIQKGLDSLKQQLHDVASSVEVLYARLLADEKPCILRSAEPLQPESLAVLLLPLPRAHADRVSATAWIPSSRYDLKNLADCWDIVVLADDQGVQTLSVNAEKRLLEARKMTQALLENRPDFLLPPSNTRHEMLGKGRRIYRARSPETEAAAKQTPLEHAKIPNDMHEAPIPQALGRESNSKPKEKAKIDANFLHPQAAFPIDKPPDTSPLVHLYDFARLVNRRKLRTDEVRKAFPEGLQLHQPNSEAAKALAAQIHAWIDQINMPPQRVDKEQWQLKLTQLKVLAWILGRPDNFELNEQDRQIHSWLRNC